MPRLKELLEYLASPGLEDLWVLLDIKVARSYPFGLLNLRVYLARQRRRRCYSINCLRHRIRSSPTRFQTLESTYRTWILGYEIPRRYLQIPPQLSHLVHRFFDELRASIFHRPKRLF